MDSNHLEKILPTLTPDVIQKFQRDQEIKKKFTPYLLRKLAMALESQELDWLKEMKLKQNQRANEFQKQIQQFKTLTEKRLQEAKEANMDFKMIESMKKKFRFQYEQLLSQISKKWDDMVQEQQKLFRSKNIPGIQITRDPEQLQVQVKIIKIIELLLEDI